MPFPITTPSTTVREGCAPVDLIYNRWAPNSWELLGCSNLGSEHRKPRKRFCSRPRSQALTRQLSAGHVTNRGCLLGKDWTGFSQDREEEEFLTALQHSCSRALELFAENPLSKKPCTETRMVFGQEVQRRLLKNTLIVSVSAALGLSSCHSPF